MATIIFTAVGNAIGGPIGGTIGSLVGRQVDQAIFGGSSREGSRLKELAVTTSSYGQPIPRIFGRMRVAGSVIWSTELSESSTSEGSKGQPSTTTYSYSASFAVALSSTPISRLGRIWADGNLLRGVNEDLKTQGSLRVYNGGGNDPVDPLIAADKGANATAFRDCAYVVFESLQLADFGNRIPALTFEIFAPNDAQVALDALVPGITAEADNNTLDHARGFADEGGPLTSSLSAINRVFPLACTVRDNTLRLSVDSDLPAAVTVLPRQLYSRDAEDANERHRKRGAREIREPLAVRYYDEDRDYQPGVQRANGLRVDGREVTIDLPATLTADGAKKLANSNAQLSNWAKEQVIWRIGELNPDVGAGSIVRLPDAPGFWQVKSWEWYDRGIELALSRIAPTIGELPQSDPGVSNPPLDLAVPPTSLRFIEVPRDGISDPSTPLLYAATSAPNSAWAGATLYTEQGAALEQAGSTSSRRALTGILLEPATPSPAVIFEPTATLSISVIASDLAIAEADLVGIANGANRLLVGGEIIQFACAEEVAEGHWRLSGLLRGRGGTEHIAISGHSSGTSVTLLNDKLVPLANPISLSNAESRIAAIGRGDDDAVYANLENQGLSRRPLCPVHSRIMWSPEGALEAFWTRRARGAWRWDTLQEVPLIEDEEQYLVGLGDTESPDQTWLLTASTFNLSSESVSSLVSQHGVKPLWVRQIGTYAVSPSLFLTNLTSTEPT
uniref:phage tail protein n=1 Tax=uncultured Erythrobacter sp. TaxID=263913 RepID=UPI0026083C93|nr:phage tail protein [uncultured Erythrobacter sp.]